MNKPLPFSPTTDVAGAGEFLNPYAASPADALPPAAKHKLASLRQQANDAHALLRSTGDALQAARGQCESARAAIAIHDEYRGQFRNAPPADANEKAARAQLSKAEAEIRRLNQLRDGRDATWNALAALTGNLDSYLRQFRNTGDIPAHTGAPLDGLPVPPSLDSVREQIAEIRADLHACRSAPVPSSEAKRRLRQHIAALGEQGKPSATSFLDDVDRITWPQKLSEPAIVRGEKSFGLADGKHELDTLALLVWLHGPAIVKKLEMEIDLCADDSQALSREQRTAREHELLAALLTEERVEEAVVEMTPGAIRRSDADARAVLNLASSLPAPRGDY